MLFTLLVLFAAFASWDTEFVMKNSFPGIRVSKDGLTVRGGGKDGKLNTITKPDHPEGTAFAQHAVGHGAKVYWEITFMDERSAEAPTKWSKAFKPPSMKEMTDFVGRKVLKMKEEKAQEEREWRERMRLKHIAEGEMTEEEAQAERDQEEREEREEAERRERARRDRSVRGDGVFGVCDITSCLEATSVWGINARTGEWMPGASLPDEIEEAEAARIPGERGLMFGETLAFAYNVDFEALWIGIVTPEGDTDWLFGGDADAGTGALKGPPKEQPLFSLGDDEEDEEDEGGDAIADAAAEALAAAPALRFAPAVASLHASHKWSAKATFSPPFRGKVPAGFTAYGS